MDSGIKPSITKIEADHDFLARVNSEADRCIAILQKHLGKEAIEKIPKFSRSIFVNYCFNVKGRPKSLGDTRQELERIRRLAQDLHRSLRDLGGSAEKVLWDAHFDFMAKPEYDRSHPEDVQQALLYFTPVIRRAQKMLPDTRRWKEDLVAERELIRELGKLYKKITGENAASGNYRAKAEYDANSTEYEYTGAFFALVEDIFYTLEIPKHTQGDEIDANNALGRAIDRALTA